MGNGTRERAEEQGRAHDKSMDSYVDSKLGGSSSLGPRDTVQAEHCIWSEGREQSPCP